MIESFKHKGLRSLFEQDDGRKVKAEQVERLRLILSALDQASNAQDLNQRTFKLHPPSRVIVKDRGRLLYAPPGGLPSVLRMATPMM